MISIEADLTGFRFQTTWTNTQKLELQE